MSPDNIGDPDLGGWRPLPRGYIPGRIQRPDYRTRDPFGYEEMGGPKPTRQSNTHRNSRNRVPDKEVRKAPSPRIWTDEERLRKRYGVQVKEKNWQACRDIAVGLLGRSVTPRQKGEALFALGFAQEKLGNVDQALRSYKDALRICPDHDAVGRRVKWLLKSRS